MLKKIFLFLLLILVGAFIFNKFFSKTTANIFNKTIPIIKNTNGITNILLLGIGGGTHDGPDLTDTIILASLNLKKNSVTLVSVPRDLWVPSLNEKINTAYQLGLFQKPANGLGFAEKNIAKITGQPIDYAFRIDFKGFEKAINLIGGIDVNVPNALDDYYYPIEGMESNNCGHTISEIKQFIATDSAEFDNWQFFSCRYKHLHVGKGINQMDGMMALEYVRSRHANGSEGTDFARSRRQQLIIEAVKAKIFSAGTILNPIKLINLFNVFKDNIDTNIKETEIPSFVNLFLKLKNAKIHTAVIDFGNLADNRQGLLIAPPISSIYGYAFVLIPRIGNGNFNEIHNFVSCEINIGNCKIKPLVTSVVK